MSFADTRRQVLHNYTLSTDYFGEDAQLIRRNKQVVPVRVKVTHRQAGNILSNTAGVRPGSSQDEKERIEVVFSRDTTWEFGGIDRKPDTGEEFMRSDSRDKDRRPFQFAGEVVFEGDVHAVYVFERQRGMVKGGGR